MDYQFLIGERFAVNGELYTVQRLRTVGDRVIAEAVTAASCSTSSSAVRPFLAEAVMEALVTEEIELFQTGGLVRG